MKLFVTDYDGTLYKDETSLKENIIKFKELQKQNIKIIISTGRSFPSIKNQVDLYHIPYDYLSCADGSILYDKDDNILIMFKMNDSIVKPFQTFYQNLNFEEIQFVYKEGYSNILNTNNELLGINVCLSTENYNQRIVDDFLKLSNNYPNYNFLNYRHPNFSYLCIKPKGINKASTIDYLVNRFKIKNNNIYVIGDSYNDYEMIKKYNGVCMESSCDEILAICPKKYFKVANYIDAILKENN